MQRICLLVTLFLCIFASSVAFAEHPRVEPPDPGKEHQIKAAMLYKITWFVRWKSSDFVDEASSINLCVLDPDPFGAILNEMVEGRLFGKYKRSITIRRIDHYNEHQSLDGCHVFFMPKDSLSPIPTRQGLLVITEDRPVESSQAHINFVTDNGHVVFEVNRKNLKASQVRLSSKLLKLARVVRD